MIKIKKLGPIKNGYQDNKGWLAVKKVTVFTCNQGSGKNTVAKLISTFMWLEKALARGDVETPISYQNFIELVDFHWLGGYLQPNTQIEYEGAAFQLVLSGDLNKKTIEATKLNRDSIKQAF